MQTNNFSDPDRPVDLLEALSVTSRKLRTLFDARVRQEGLTLARARTLMNLARHQCLTQKDLAVLLEIEGPTLVRLLDKLESQDWIVREAVDGDRRAKHISLTPRGAEMATRVFTLADQLRADVFAGLTPHQLDQAADVLRSLGQNVALLQPSSDVPK